MAPTCLRIKLMLYLAIILVLYCKGKTRINQDELLTGFKQGVLAKHGKLHSVLGDELEDAIKAYMTNHLAHSPCTRTHVELTQKGLKVVKAIMNRINLKFSL